MKSLRMYPWQDSCLPLVELNQMLEARRLEILDEDDSALNGEKLPLEWLALITKRNEVTEELVRQENRKRMLGHFMELEALLVAISDFGSYVPVTLQHTISILCKEVCQYVGKYDESKENSVGVQTSIPDQMCSVETMTQTDHMEESRDDSLTDVGEGGEQKSAAQDVGHLEGDDAVTPLKSDATEVVTGEVQPVPHSGSDYKTLVSDSTENAECFDALVPAQQHSSCDGAGKCGTDSLSFTTDKTCLDSDFESADLDRSGIPDTSHCTDTGREAIANVLPIRTSTPEDVAGRTSDDLSVKARPKRRSKKVHRQPRKKSRLSPDTEPPQPSMYRPMLWGLMTNVINWYNTKPGSKATTKAGSLQISID